MALSRQRRRAITLSVLGVLVAYGIYAAGGLVAGVRGLLGDVTEPFVVATDVVTRPIGHILAGVINYSDVVAQNHQLREELGQQEMLNAENAAAGSALQQLTDEEHLPFVGTLPTVAAEVTAISPTNYAATVDIDKGRDDGVLAGMPVVANGGLIGRVVSTTLHGATVQLITDADSEVSVTFGTGQSAVLLSGRGVNNDLAVSSVPLTDQVGIGSILVTSGLQASEFPPNLPVAKVTRVTVTPGASTYGASVTPTADLDHLDYVQVLLWEPST
jgi:rod shape-determining protein MreC